MARPKLTPKEREKRRIKRQLTRNFFMEALRRETRMKKTCPSGQVSGFS